MIVKNILGAVRWLSVLALGLVVLALVFAVAGWGQAIVLAVSAVALAVLASIRS